METETKALAVSGQVIPIGAVASDVERSVRLGSMSFEDLQRLGKLIAATGYFNDVTDLSQAVVKMLAGAEIGIGPITSITDIHVIKGKVVPGAHILAAKIKTCGYDYRIRDLTPERCKIEFYRGPAPRPGEEGDSLGFATFNYQEAVDAGLSSKDNWQKWRMDMLFARAITRGQKRHCPDVTRGMAVYTEDEAQAIKVQNRYTYDPELDGGSREAQLQVAADTIAKFKTQEAERNATETPAVNGVAEPAEDATPGQLDWDKFTAEQRALVLPMLWDTLDAKNIPHDENHYREYIAKWDGGMNELLEQARALAPMQEKSAKRKRKKGEPQPVAEIADETDLGV